MERISAQQIPEIYFRTMAKPGHPTAMKRHAIMALSILQGERFFAPTAQRVVWNDRLSSDDVFSR
jgi:hypothetical protein